MSDFENVLKSRLESSTDEFRKNTNAVSTTASLLNAVNQVAQDAVSKANGADDLAAKIQFVNQGLIDVVAIVEQAARFTREAVHKFRVETSLIDELLNQISNIPEEDEQDDEEEAEESDQEAEDEAEESEQEEAIEPTE